MPTFKTVSMARAFHYKPPNNLLGIIGASLSEPYTGWKTMCTSVTYMAIMNENMRWQPYVRATRKWMVNENVAAKRVYEHHVNGWGTRM